MAQRRGKARGGIVGEPQSADEERQTLVEESSPIDGAAEQLALKETTITDLEKSSAWAQLKLIEFKEIIGHRKNWSNGLLLLVMLIVVMDFLVVIFVGAGWLLFQSAWAIPTFVAANLAEVFGLSLLVVRFLFPSPKIGDKRSKDDT
jgi:hypothetical protein